MSKTKTFLTLALLVLLGSMGAAQAQTIARVNLLSAPEMAAREGGKAEAAGDVFLDIAGTPASIASYTLTYSVPVVLPGDPINNRRPGLRLRGERPGRRRGCIRSCHRN